MQSQDITSILTEYFGKSNIQMPSSDTWQVETPQMRLLAILSEDSAWLRLLVPIAPTQEVESFLEQFLEANFDLTQDVRYALHQEVLWGVFQHSCKTLTAEDLKNAIAQLVFLKEKGLNQAFQSLVENRIRQIVQAAKAQGQTLEATLQNLDRLYEEGMLGGLQQDPQERKQFLAAWQYQLERLWNE